MQFIYKAIRNNKIIKGKIEGESEKKVIDYLKSQGLIVVSVNPVVSSSVYFFQTVLGKISFTDIVDFTRQLAIMLNAGLTLVDCFDILKKQITKPAFLKMILKIDEEVRAGNSFSNALKKTGYFNNLYIALVRSGEKSGKLDQVLLKLADNLEKAREFRAKIKGALIYPIIVVLAMIGVMFIMVTFVVPRLLNLYKDFNLSLPITTQILILISEFLQKFWILIITSIFLGGYLFSRWQKTVSGKKTIDGLLLKIPMINKVIKMSSLVDSTRTLSILIGSGVPILEALEIVIETSDNLIFQQAFKNVFKKIEKGESLGKAFEEEEIFPPILVQMATVGEQTGHLDETLIRISRYFEMESTLAIKAMTTLIEPAILLFLGLGVFFLVSSVISPIYQLTTSIK